MPGLKPFSFPFRFRARFFVLSLLCFCVGPGLSGGQVLASDADLAVSQPTALPQSVVITQKPLTLLVSELIADKEGMAGHVTLKQVIPDGASPHEFSLSWSGRRQLADADLVVWGGAMLEPQLAQVMASLPAGKVFDASSAVTDWPQAVDCHDNAEDHAGGTEHEGSGHDRHDAGHSVCRDPHFWLNPRNMAAVTEALVERLRTLDGTAAKNVDSLAWLESSAHALLERIDTLDRQAQALLAPLADRFYVVEHDAYNHFSRRYDLRQPGFLRAGHGMPIGPRSFSALLARTDIGCVFTEPEYSPRLAQRLAAHSGATLQALDPLGSQMELAEGYSGFMARFVTTFAGCFAESGAKPKE